MLKTKNDISKKTSLVEMTLKMTHRREKLLKSKDSVECVVCSVLCNRMFLCIYLINILVKCVNGIKLTKFLWYQKNQGIWDAIN